MRHLGYFDPETSVRAMNLIGIPVLVAYILCMFVAPWVIGSWLYVQSVWHHWQALNVGMLAFLSSVIAFNMTRYNSERQRDRDFTAAKAFLPEALSELNSYFMESADLLSEAWRKRNSFDDHGRVQIESPVPRLPERYKEVFAQCIRYANPPQGKYLAYILNKLQIHHSRIKELKDSFGPDSNMLVIPQNIISYLYCLGELMALKNRLYGYARNLEPFDGSHLKWDDFHNAYANLNIFPDDYDDLIGFTKRAIERKQSDRGT